LYVNFLVNANNDTNTIIAFNWELNKSKMTADIIRNGKIIKDATFDFDSYHSNINDVGYSNDLESEVVVAPFSRRGVCMTLYIPLEAKSEMLYHAEFAFEREKTEYINRVKHFINGG